MWSFLIIHQICSEQEKHVASQLTEVSDCHVKVFGIPTVKMVVMMRIMIHLGGCL